MVICPVCQVFDKGYGHCRTAPPYNPYCPPDELINEFFSKMKERRYYNVQKKVKPPQV